MRLLITSIVVFAFATVADCKFAFSQRPDHGIAFKKDGFRVVGWLPFNDHPNGSVSMVELPNKKRSIDYPVKLYFTGDAFGTKTTFLLCLATGPELNARGLTLVAVDTSGVEIPGLRHSTDTDAVEAQQLVVFLRHDSGVHFKRIAKIVVLSKLDGG